MGTVRQVDIVIQAPSDTESQRVERLAQKGGGILQRNSAGAQSVNLVDGQC